jgi:hypothetical protein
MMSTHAMPVYERKDIPGAVRRTGSLLVLAGVVLAAAAYLIDPRRAAFDNIVGFLFLTSIAAGSLFLVALEYIGGAVWSTPFRRISEFLAALLPVVPVVALPVFTQMGEVFPWARPELLQANHVLAGKAAYLNTGFFSIRFVAAFALWGLFAYVFFKNSQLQDISRDQNLTKRSIRVAAAFLPVFAITLTVTAIDWGMSIEPMWFSTIFGVYYFSGTVLAALSSATFIIVLLHENGYLPALRRDNFYSLGALMFAFINFWAYIAFSQFLLIWYANLPEETFWFIRRWHNGWEYVSIAQVFVHFLVPYFALLTQDSKMDLKRLKIMSVWILFAHLLDLYWLVIPGYSEGVTVGLGTIAFPVLAVGLVIVVFTMRAKKVNLIPIGDPKLERGLNFRL